MRSSRGLAECISRLPMATLSSSVIREILGGRTANPREYQLIAVPVAIPRCLLAARHGGGGQSRTMAARHSMQGGPLAPTHATPAAPRHGPIKPVVPQSARRHARTCTPLPHPATRFYVNLDAISTPSWVAVQCRHCHNAKGKKSFRPAQHRRNRSGMTPVGILLNLGSPSTHGWPRGTPRGVQH